MDSVAESLKDIICASVYAYETRTKYNNGYNWRTVLASIEEIEIKLQRARKTMEEEIANETGPYEKMAYRSK